MRTALILCGVALALFAVSAGASVLLFYPDLLTPKKTQEAKDKEPPDSGKEPPPLARGNDKDSGPRPLNQRPGYNPETEQAVQLAAKLREQEAQLNKQQQKLVVQRSYLEMMQKDMREEHEADKRKHDEIKKELADTAMLRVESENKAKEAVEVKAETSKMINEAKKTLVEVEKNQNSQSRRVAGITDAMPPEAVAVNMVQLASTGKGQDLDTAVLLLSRMKERKAAEVLAAITAQDPDIAKSLLERMLLLRTAPPPATPVTPVGGTQP